MVKGRRSGSDRAPRPDRGDTERAARPDRGDPERLVVSVRVKPGASRTRVGGRHDGPAGPSLVVAVSAPPVDGRATTAALEAVAAALGVRRGAVTLVSGRTGRDKVFAVEPAPPSAVAALRTLLDG